MEYPRRGLGQIEPTPLRVLLIRLINQSAVYIVFLFLLGLVVFVSMGIIKVDEGEMAILIKKTGQDLPDGEIIATDASYKGIQLLPIAEGWYFYNPYIWDHEIVPQTTINEGELRVQICLFGNSLDAESFQILAKNKQKGVMREILRPGKWMVNPYAFSLEPHKAVTVPAGFNGVVTNMAGPLAKTANSFLIEEGERGISRNTLEPGTYYVNPYETQITTVDMRSHRFDMKGADAIEFPSADGFAITMEGTVEWTIDRDRLAEVFVKYKDDESEIIQGVVEKIILPNARAYSRIEGSKHPAKVFIADITRVQEQFIKGLKKSCNEQGIDIRAAVFTQCIPPIAIATPVKQRQIAQLERNKYEKEIERERQEIQLKKEETRQAFGVLTTNAKADVSVKITNAQREKEVAIIEMEQKLEVVTRQLEAAKNEAASILSAAEAAAAVIRMNNKAEASGLQETREAFGDDGRTYVRFLLMEKIATGLGYILANTDSPFLEAFQRMAEERRASQQAQSAPRAEKEKGLPAALTGSASPAPRTDEPVQGNATPEVTETGEQ